MNSETRRPACDAAQMTLDSIGDGVISIDVDGNVTYLNPAAERMTGWSCHDAWGRSHLEVLRIIDGESREPALNPLAMAILHNKTATLSANSVLIRRDGEETAIEDTAAPIRDERGLLCGAVIVFHDVSASRARSQQMLHAAQHDALTGLPNRLLLTERLTQAMSLARRRGTLLALLYLDVDRFKQINDSMGHAIGDQLLRSMAHRMTDCVRESDTVSRHGGDEFIVLLPEVAHGDDATVCAQNLLVALRRPYPIEKLVLRVTVSIGIGVYPTDGADAEAVLRHADRAMFNAKQRGGAQYEILNPHPGECATRFLA
ncbi:MAG: diguanylate cyclase domain-containing protein [Steroidobacteraceae bacterium]|jgi:diguanylate cyclase (GGDEF)-like protein/PAS domain S-box-containing protein